MKKPGKKYLEACTKADLKKTYSIEEALNVVKQVAFAKFDETVDVAFRLGVDPRHADQLVRGSIALPGGTGKTLKIVAITSGDNLTAAEKAGADFFGGDDIITKIAGGWLDFDRVIATPDMMGKLGKVARILGPRGLMPNPKLGTVTTDITRAINEQKAGKVEYKTDKSGIVHVVIGKKSFDADKLKANFMAILTAILRAKPSSSKGSYLKSIRVATTMSPGVKIDILEAAAHL
jgi:large subunit ribosomal protein L1